ncbi:MAG: undecaprenyl-phosphate glucose phosphotransferase [Chromatocurvus sp.]
MSRTLANSAPVAGSATVLWFAPLLDAGALFVAGYTAWFWRFARLDIAPGYLVAMVMGMLLALVLLPGCRAYRAANWWHPLRGVAATIPGLAAVFSLLMLLATLTKTSADFSRMWMAGWLTLSLLLMIMWRFACLPLLHRQPARHVLLLGSGILSAEVAARLEIGAREISIAGCIALPGELAASCETQLYPVQTPPTLLGSLDDLDRLLADGSQHIDELWLVPDRAPGQEDEYLLTQLRLTSLPVHYVPNLSVLRLLGQRAGEIAGINTVELNATPLDGPDALLKRIMDRVLSAFLIVALAPVMLFIALMIRLDSPGPLLFRQRRHGSGGRIFDVLKFRSMVHHNHPDDHRQARLDDPRTTRVGAFLRRTSLDELPQLINVLRGDMSLVGPRPHPVALNQQYADRLQDYMQRHRVLPGITGWAQVNGFRGETDTLDKMAGRLEHDLYYIQHWSLGLDVRILARTLLLIWGDRNAY